MMPDFTIRTATEADLPFLPPIEDDAAVAFAAVGYGFCTEHPPRSIEVLREDMEQGTLLLAEVGETIVGFAIANYSTEAAHLRELSVLRSHHKRGIGLALLHAIEACSREKKHDTITLTTFRDVPWNAPWYARQGFEVITAGDLPEAHRALLSEELAMVYPHYPRVTMRKVLSRPDA